MRTSSFLVIIVGVFLYAISSPATGCGERIGNQLWSTTIDNGWEPIRNINDKHIQELGSWAVLEFIKHVNCVLKFNKVVSGRQQLVSGMNYELIINASDFGGKDGKYKAEVYEQKWTSKRELLSFTKVN
uniref:Cystatin Hv-CPI13 n=1 Tax=Hordeum vulgare TaxID=4513 RepID=Q1ENE5_HORVU|nr:cystatin Hv-CPI13 [Hordeum vulgare subsp. vulgare]